MSDAVNTQLVNNISIILKQSLAADATLKDLRDKGMAKFSQIFKSGEGFNCSADTFQPYVEEVADNLVAWQQNRTEQALITLVKQIELLLTVLSTFQKSHQLK